MSEPQVQRQPTITFSDDGHSEAPSARASSTKSRSLRAKADFFSKGRPSNVASSLPALRTVFSGRAGGTVHAKSLAAFHSSAYSLKPIDLRGFSREVLGLPKKKAVVPNAVESAGTTRTLSAETADRVFNSEDGQRARRREEEEEEQDWVLDDEQEHRERQALDRARLEEEHQRESRSEFSGNFTQSLGRHHIQRTDNGFDATWAASKPVAAEFEVPGVLEIDADTVPAPPGTLEPVRDHHPAPVNSMHPYTAAEQKILEKIEARISYLPNPRFPNKRVFLKRVVSDKHPGFVPPGVDTRWLAPDAAAKKLDSLHMEKPEQLGILAIPASVVFTDYAPNQTYEKEVVVKNVTQNSHRFRLSEPPPYAHSPYFTVKLVSAPAEHGTNGLVAPGMSLKYKVTFTPNSLANFREVFLVSTETGRGFHVPFIAQREAPRLTLPYVLNCGPSRAGYDNVRAWDFRNEGGPGRFLLVPDYLKVDPYTVFDTMEERQKYAIASSPPFDVFPAFFNLKKGESSQVVVRYSPAALGDDDEWAAAGGRIDEVTFKLVCDNCTISDFPVRGLAQDPGIQIASVATSDGVLVNGPENSIPGYDFYLPFGKQNPGATTMHKVTIRNTSRLRLPYHWNVFNVPSDVGAKTESLQKNDSFQINPIRGWLPPNADTTFQMSFTPEETKYFDVLCNLNLLHSDRQKDGLQPADVPRKHGYGCAISMRCTGHGVPFQMSIRPAVIIIPDTLHTGSTYSTELQLSNESVSNVAFQWEFQNINENVLDITVSQTSGSIEAWSCSALRLNCSGLFPGRVDGVLNCRIAHGPTIRVPITAFVGLAPGALRFDTDVVDFGLLALGSKKTVEVPLISRAPIPLHWKVGGFKRDRQDGEEDCYTMYEPSEGLIYPNDTQILKITYVPVWYQSLRAVLECSIVADNPMDESHYDRDGTYQSEPLASMGQVPVAAVEMRAEVQTPRARISHPINAITCFQSVPCAYSVELRNISMLPAEFQWQDVENEEYSVRFSPGAGKIPGGQNATITVTFLGLVIGKLSGLMFACHIVGMVEHNSYLGIELQADVCGIDVALRIEDETHLDSRRDPPRSTFPSEASFIEPQLSFDFGAECPIFANRHGTLIIRNRSAISAPFRLYMEKYEATLLKTDGSGTQPDTLSEDEDDAPLQAKRSARTQKGSGKSLLPASNIERLGFSSKTGMEYISQIKEVRRMIKRMHLLLREGRGAAFHSSPNSKTLGPWGTVRVNITSYNNLVGLYEDNLVCEIRGWPKQVIPISLGVVGLPVRFSGAHLVARPKESKDTIDHVNFGTRITNLTWASVNGVRAYPFPRTDRTEEEALQLGDREAHSKVINIENQSPRDIRLTWVTFIKLTQLGGKSATVEEILKPENRLEQDALGLFGVSPATMVVPAFKTTSIRIFFRSAMVGQFDALLVADVGYIQKDGKPLYGHGRRESTKRPGTDDAFPASHLSSMACVQIQGRAIEPHLSLDIGDRIRMKETFWGKPDDGPSLSGSEGRNVNVFLENNTDSVCSFTMHATPPDLFTVTGADETEAPAEAASARHRFSRSKSPRRSVFARSNLMAANHYLHEIKPTTQLLITVRYTPRPGRQQGTSTQAASANILAEPEFVECFTRSEVSTARGDTRRASELPADEIMASDEDASVTTEKEEIQESEAMSHEDDTSPNLPPPVENATDSVLEPSIQPPGTEPEKLAAVTDDQKEAPPESIIESAEARIASTGPLSDPTTLSEKVESRPATAIKDLESSLERRPSQLSRPASRPTSKSSSETKLTEVGTPSRHSRRASLDSHGSARLKKGSRKLGRDTVATTVVETVDEALATPVASRPTTARSRVIAEGTLNITFTNGCKQSIPLVVEETT
ncbi:Deleted in lung and esophageal cancer protein 1 [Thoreauomyces humboldtii]|nr:Deleted in lung and esophageal cancer protein 1 [Thoreauomyces humboldtii]